VKTTRHTVVIIEEDFQFLESLVKTISTSDTWQVIGSHLRAETALKAIPMNRPDAVITNIRLPGMSGIELLRDLKAAYPKMEFIVVTENADKVFDALAAGASGYVLKRDVHRMLLDYLTDVLTGGAPMSGAIARKVVEHFHLPGRGVADGKFDLTPRETETLHLLTKGCLYKEIAKELGVTVSTIAFHVGNIYRKLQVKTRSEAILKYVVR
jgi:DNA-binding NarL/FixJ family response regulator